MPKRSRTKIAIAELIACYPAIREAVESHEDPELRQRLRFIGQLIVELQEARDKKLAPRRRIGVAA